MTHIALFPDDQVIGIFRGFREGGMEFHADLVLPYRNDFQSIPMHGQFLLVQLETPDEAVLGRIASFSSEGKLSVGSGEEFNIRAVQEGRVIPEDLREQYLKYRVNIRVLGVLRSGEELKFIASHRRLPHVGSKVALPSAAVLQTIAGHNDEGTPVGHFALGEYIYASGSTLLAAEDWMQQKEPEVLVRFPVESLVSRRSFVFARAGFGKSNLNKLLFSRLYGAGTPTVTKRGGKEVPVGTVLFDPDGEYFWPDDKGRPGLCDVPELRDHVVVFTPRAAPSDYYGSFVADGIKLDVRRLSPSDVISISLSPERQEQQNVRKLKGLGQDRWERLVDLVDRDRNQADLEEISEILDLKESQEMEALAARANVTAIVSSIHDRTSQLMDKLFEALAEGKLCVVDVSQLRDGQSLMLSGLILRKIFEHNQREFVEKDSKTIPTIAVVEEAQSVLNGRGGGSDPYVAWVKEGRKYDLGALLITQQPGSIPMDILSQGDNWFIFHLLSAMDLSNVKRANAHFSDDLLSALLNEPIQGQGVFWSSVGERPYPIAMRALSFEKLYRAHDTAYNEPAVETYASKMKRRYDERLLAAYAGISENGQGVLTDEDEGDQTNGARPGRVPDTLDVKRVLEEHAIRALKENLDAVERLRSDRGMAYGSVKAFLKDHLEEVREESERDSIAYRLVPQAVSSILGDRDRGWHTYKNEQNKTYIRAGRDPEPS